MLEEFEQAAKRHQENLKTKKVARKPVFTFEEPVKKIDHRVKINATGTQGAVSVERGSPFWNKKVCTFRPEEGDIPKQRYQTWFFQNLDGGNLDLNEAVEGLVKKLLQGETVVLGCDNPKGINHVQVIRDYLIWEHNRKASPFK